MSPVSKDNLDSVFTYHPADDLQVIRYEAIRSKAKEMAEVILDNTPLCADQTAALRKLRESVMTANAAIALKGLVILLLTLAVGSLAFAAECPTCPPTTEVPVPVVVKQKVEVPAPAKGQWYLLGSALYLDRLGVGLGPGYKLKNGVLIGGQVLYRDAKDGIDPTSTRIGCRTVNCPGCSDQAGLGVGFTVGIPLGGH